jgi:hypothetical protein
MLCQFDVEQNLGFNIYHCFWIFNPYNGRYIQLLLLSFVKLV